MAKLGLWAASAVGAAAAGAGLAVLRRKRPPGEAPVAGPAAVAAPAPEPKPTVPAEDPQAALDAARDRLRARADELRAQIEGSGGAPSAEG
jgi:hypothetical protein